MKEFFCTTLGLAGAALASAFGGWSTAMVTLMIFLGIDYATGLIVAGIFQRSKKTSHGGLESRAGWKGLVRKGVTLLCVLVAHRLDLLLEVSYIQDAVVIAFCVNEVLSIVENVALMGVTIPKPLQKAIELMKAESDPGPVDRDVDYKAGYYIVLDELKQARKELQEITTTLDKSQVVKQLSKEE